MRLILFIILLTALGCGSSEKLDNKRLSLLHLNLGTSMLNDGHIPQAFKELLAARRLDPENPITHNNLGIAYSARKKNLLAEKSFEKAILLNPNYTDARNNLGRLLCEVGKNKKCISLLLRAQKDLTYPYPEKILYNLGYAYMKNKQFHIAKSKLREALEIQPNHCHSFYYYARAHYSLEDYEQAALLFDRSIRLCRKFSFEEPGYYSGLSYLKLGKNELAVAKFEEVIQRAPLNEYASRSKKMLNLMAKAKGK